MDMRKIYTLLILLQVCICNIQSQNTIDKDDSNYARIAEILKSYDSHSVFIDTSEYISGYTDALNINLQYASYAGFCREIVRLVVKGADINSSNYEKATPLHYAVANGEKDAAEIILLIGGDANAKDINGKTPLLVAIEEGNLEIADVLIRYGAMTSEGDHSGLTPLHFAVKNNDFYITDMLLYYNTDPNISDKKGDTPLMYAVWKRDYEIADLLLQSGANPDIPDKNGFTPFMVAAQIGDTLMLSLLNRAGAEIYSINSYGYDALSLAIRFGQNTAVKYLKSIGNLWYEKKPGKVDQKIIALEYGNKQMNISDESKMTTFSEKLYFNRVSLSAGGITSNHLSLLTGEISFRDPALKAGIFAAYTFSPTESKVLVSSGDLYYQYFVSMKTIEAGLFRDWTLGKKVVNGNFKAYTSLSGAYKTYSEFAGTKQKPADKFCIIPSAGLQYLRNNLGISTELSYMKTPFYKVYPIWLSLKLSVNLLTDQASVPGKQINLGNNE
jgi:ankyrin repeat protein